MRSNFFLLFTFYFLLSLLLYSPVLGSFFVSDDFDWLARAKEIPLTWQSYLLSNADGYREGGVYRPLTNFSFWLNYQTNGLSPSGYHLVNIIFHGLNAFLVFWLVWLLRRSDEAMLLRRSDEALLLRRSDEALLLRRSDEALLRHSSVAFLAGLFFLILPNHSEAVAWLSARGDVLVTFFYLLSLISYLYFRERKKIVFLFLSLIAFTLTLGAKEMAITLPLIIIALEFVFFHTFGKGLPRVIPRFNRGIQQNNVETRHCLVSTVWPVLPFFILLLGYLLLRYQTTGLFLGYYASADLSFSWLAIKETLIRSFISNFLAGQSRQLVSGFLVGHWVLFGLFLLMVCLFWFRFWKKDRRLFLFAVMFFILTLLPVLNLSLSRLTDEGERLVYLPSVGLALVLSLIIFNVFNVFNIFRPTMRLAVGLGLIVLLSLYFSFSLFQKNLNWQKAGQLSQNLLADFSQQTNLKAGEGIVILGLPDNIEGAFVFRNGWLNALKLIYPAYSPDVLAVKAGLNLSRANFNKKVADWEILPDGYQATASSPVPLFRGKRVLTSLDYSMEIKDYEPRIESGERVEFHFTPQFKAQMANKVIRFFVLEEGNLKELTAFK